MTIAYRQLACGCCWDYDFSKSNAHEILSNFNFSINVDNIYHLFEALSQAGYPEIDFNDINWINFFDGSWDEWDIQRFKDIENYPHYADFVFKEDIELARDYIIYKLQQSLKEST